MLKFWAKEMARGTTLVVFALILILSAVEIAQSSGFGACLAAVRDDILSTLGVADGEPSRVRLNASGALWTVDSDLANAIFNTQLDIEDDGEGGSYSKVFPTGTRHINVRLAFQGGFGASATDYALCGFSAGSAGIFLSEVTPLADIPNLDIGPLGVTLFADSGGGKLRLKFWWTVSQSPD